MSRPGIQTQEPTRTQLVDQTESLSTDMTDTEKQDPPLPLPSIVGTDWDGPEDSENPHNWPLWVRIYHATTPGLFGFAV